MNSVIITVTPNPALDVTYSVARIRPGQTHRMPPGTCRAGGKGLNVARVLHQMGLPVHAIATAGGPTGEEFARELADSGIGHQLVAVGPETRRSMAIMDTASGQASIFNELGRPIPTADYDRLRAAAGGQLAGAGALVGSGSLPEAAPATFYPSLVEAAHEAGIPCIIDTSGPALLEAARAGADALKPNAEELIAATGHTDIPTAAAAVLELGAGSVFVSCGPDGIMYFARHGVTYLQARLPQPLTGNATGAGDAAVAAIAAGLAASAAPTEILTRAVAWSAAAVLAPTAGQLHRDYADFEARVVLETYPTT